MFIDYLLIACPTRAVYPTCSEPSLVLLSPVASLSNILWNRQRLSTHKCLSFHQKVDCNVKHWWTYNG